MEIRGLLCAAKICYNRDIMKDRPDFSEFWGAPGGADSMALLAGRKVAAAWGRLMDFLAANPSVWLEVAGEAQQKQMRVAEQLGSGGESPNPPDASANESAKHSSRAAKGDRRFAGEQWHENPFFSFIRQNYLLGGEALFALIERADVCEDDKKILRFAAGQYVDATSPANFPLTNPEVLEDAAKTGGQNFAAGMQNFAEDMQAGAIGNTDKTAFAPGDNIACSPGKVVFQNEVMQLIEYAPQSKKVFARPLLIVPPCINKYYILDLQQKNSFVAHAVSRGQRVFLISWVNAGMQHRNMGWDVYLREGVMAAIDAACAISGQAKINTLGFCIGGTLLASALAVLAADGHRPSQSLTLLAAMLDFSDSGDIGMFMDEEYVSSREKEFADGGLVDGGELARGFAALRPNDLIWPYVINNYYRGQKPPAFDLLYWNADSTNLPGPLFAEYLRTTYLENQIASGDAEFCGVKVDVSKIKIPTYAVACEKDHIVPWRAAFNSARLLCDGVKPAKSSKSAKSSSTASKSSSASRFILAASGHIAGIINPPSVGKGWHMGAPMFNSVNEEKWREGAKKENGGWWDDWLDWLSKHSGKQVAAPAKQGSARYAPLEDAPGQYVCAPKFDIRPPMFNTQPPSGDHK